MNPRGIFAYGLIVVTAFGVLPATGTANAQVEATTSTAARARIAFVVDFPERGESFIYTSRPDGSALKRLTHDGSAWSPAWSPDGTKIAFESKRDGDVEILVMDRDGSNVVQLTDNGSSDASPAWSPDGQWIAFASDAESTYEGTFDLYNMRSDGMEVTRLTSFEGQEWTPTWSPDGTEIVFGGDDRIALMNADGSNIREISGGRVAQSPDWAPDGSRLALQIDHLHAGGSEIYVMLPDGSGLERLTRRGGPDQAPAWSPSSQRIAYSRDWSLAVMRADGSRQKTVYGGPGDVYAPDWGRSVVPSEG